MSGWIKIHRSIKDHWLYTEKRVFSRFEAWNDILLTVNYSDAQTLIKGKLYNVKRGESILSLDSWAKRWGWEKSSVRRFLKLLENESMVVLDSDNVTTRLTVCNYESYQDERNADETRKKLKRNSNEIQTTPIKEEKEEQEEKRRVFIKPTTQEVQEYMKEIEYNGDAEYFINYYQSKGWVVGKSKMKDWKSAVQTWKRNDKTFSNKGQQQLPNRPKLATL